MVRTVFHIFFFVFYLDFIYYRFFFFQFPFHWASLPWTLDDLAGTGAPSDGDHSFFLSFFLVGNQEKHTRTRHKLIKPVLSLSLSLSLSPSLLYCLSRFSLTVHPPFVVVVLAVVPRMAPPSLHATAILFCFFASNTEDQRSN